MTTDIKGLMRKGEAAVSKLNSAFEPGHISPREVDALSDAVDVMRELAEALEAKDSTIAEMQESNEQVIHSRDHYKHISEELMRRIHELQSRAEAAESRAITVTLPERYGVEMCPIPAPDGEWYHRDDILKALDAAGIQILGGE